LSGSSRLSFQKSALKKGIFISHANPVILESVEALARLQLTGCRHRPLLLGLCGSQGSGKSTLASALRVRLESSAVRTAVISLDDIYKTKAERARMAHEVHPLFSTRGVPGTHDLQLLWNILGELEHGRPVRLPRFDKSSDERAPESAWDTAKGDTAVLILEGWCVGVRSSSDFEDPRPINQLEKWKDAGGRWRALIEDFIEREYRPLFARIDCLALLAAPSFDVVHDWRVQQEQALRTYSGRGMADREIVFFIQHYERLTRRILLKMPDYADLVIRLDADRRPKKVDWKVNAADAYRRTPRWAADVSSKGEP
jgi:D-glycerate 3-kinase